MKVTLDIPEARFRLGDVVRVPNTQNTEAFFYRIIAIWHYGEWSWRCIERPTVTVTRETYGCKPLVGSVYDDVDATPYDKTGGPDTEGIHVKFIASLDNHGELIEAAKRRSQHEISSALA